MLLTTTNLLKIHSRPQNNGIRLKNFKNITSITVCLRFSPITIRSNNNINEENSVSKSHLEPLTWAGRFCLANWLAVGFIKVELLGKKGLTADLALAFSLSVYG